jgi:hypothetical protein
MTGKIPKSVGAILAAVAILAIAASTAGAATVYNNLIKPKPKNTPSEAFEATSTSEFGGAITAGGTLRKNPSVKITLSSWACQEGAGASCVTHGKASFNWPVTVKLYELGPGGTVGALVTESTQTLAIPYRPSANNKLCSPNPEGAVGYGSECFHGVEAQFNYPLTGTLPNEAIVAIAYNTTNYGATPVGPAACSAFTPSRCAYDSLNVGLEEGAGASVGSQPLPADVFQSSTWTGAYCDNGAGGTGTFRDNAGCWTGEQPLLQVKASK